MGRRVVEKVVILLDVLAVISLVTGQTEQPLLENRVGAVPERRSEGQMTVIVGKAEQAVLAPTISALSGVVVRKVLPGVPVLGIVLTHCSPLPLGEVWTPESPGYSALPAIVEAKLLGVFATCVAKLFGHRSQLS